MWQWQWVWLYSVTGTAAVVRGAAAQGKAQYLLAASKVVEKSWNSSLAIGCCFSSKDRGSKKEAFPPPRGMAAAMVPFPREMNAGALYGRSIAT